MDTHKVSKGVFLPVTLLKLDFMKEYSSNL